MKKYKILLTSIGLIFLPAITFLSCAYSPVLSNRKININNQTSSAPVVSNPVDDPNNKTTSTNPVQVGQETQTGQTTQTTPDTTKNKPEADTHSQIVPTKEEFEAKFNKLEEKWSKIKDLQLKASADPLVKSAIEYWIPKVKNNLSQTKINEVLVQTGIDVLVVKLKEFEDSIDKTDPISETKNPDLVGSKPIVVEDLKEKRSKIKQELYRNMLEGQYYNIKKLSSSTPLPSKEFGYYSYVNPALKKVNNGDLLLSVDGRKFNDKDTNNRVDQVLISSKDEGNLWDNDINQIVSVGGGDADVGIANSGSFVEVSNPKNPSEKMLIYIFNIWLPDFNYSWYRTRRGEFVNDNINWRQFYIFENKDEWTKYKNGTTGANDTKYIAKPILFNGKPNWWKIYKVKSNTAFKDIDINTDLEDINTYLDNNYDPVSKRITGNVYEEVPARQIKLKGKSFSNFLKDSPWIDEIWSYDSEEPLSNYLSGSIYDTEQNREDWDKITDSKTRKEVFDKAKIFALDATSKLYSLESYDNGKTWSNLTDLDFQLSLEDGQKQGHYFGGLISGSGNGVQLTNQNPAEKKANGRILFPVYWWTWSDPTTNTHEQKQAAIWIYSDDQGQTWHRLAKDPTKESTFESSIVEDEKGRIFINKKNATTHPSVTYVSNIISQTPQTFDLPVDNNNVFSSKNNLGFAVFNWDNDIYYLITAPKTNTTNGTIFLYKGTDLTHPIKAFEITDATTGFANSSLEITFRQGNYLEFAVAYETYEDIKKLNLSSGKSIKVDKFAMVIK